MADYLQQYRAANPNDSRSDSDVLDEAYAQGKLNSFPEDKALVEQVNAAMKGVGGEKSSAAAAFAKSAAAGVVPAGGAWAGFEGGALIGAPLAPETFGIAPLVTGLIGAAAGSVAAYKAQKAVLDKVAPKAEGSIEQAELDHPAAAAIGNIAAGLPMFEANPGQTLKGVAALYRMARGVAVSQADKDAAKALAAQVGMGTGAAVLTPMIEGQKPTLQGVGENVLTAMILGKPRFQMPGVNSIARSYTDSTRKLLGLKPLPESTEGELPPPPDQPSAPATTPADNYQIQMPALERQGQIKQVVQRELAGEDTPQLHSDLAYIQSDPAQNAYYTLTKRNTVEAQKVAAANVTAHLIAKAVDNGHLDLTGKEGENHASKKPGAESVPVSEVRQQVGEETPLRQQGEIAAAGTETPKVTSEPTLPIPETHTPPPAPEATAPSGAAPQSDYDRYQELTAAGNAMLAKRQIPSPEILAELEQVKNRHGGMPPEPPQPIEHDPNELIPHIAFDEAQVKRQAEGGRGKKASQAFEETSDPNVIYQDARASGKDRKLSRKMGVFAKGDTVTVGTVYEASTSGKLVRYVTGQDGKAKRYDDLIADGWRPIASIKRSEPVKDFVATYSSDRWRPASEAMRQMQGAAQRTTEAMSAKIFEGGFNRQDESPVEDAVHGSELEDRLAEQSNEEQPAAAEAVADQTKPVEFDSDHATAIWKAVEDADPEHLKDVRGLVTLLKDAGQDAVDAFKVAVRQLVNKHDVPPEQVVEILRNQIYEHVSSDVAGGSKAFAEAILRLTGEPGGERSVPRGGASAAVSAKAEGEHGAGTGGSVSKEGGAVADTQTDAAKLKFKAAIKLQDGSVISGISHNTIREKTGPTVGSTPGYVDQNGAFYTLLEAVRARQSGLGELAERIESAGDKTDSNPTEAQKESGVYPKGEVELDGFDMVIENPRGTVRSGTGFGGKQWSVRMPVDYGYIKGVEGFDGDAVDVYIGRNPDGYKKVWVVDQIDPATKKFDEHKALIGFNDKQEALAAYRGAFEDNADSRIGAVTEMSREDFKDWVQEGDMGKPLAYGKRPISDRNRALKTIEGLRDSSPEVFRKFNALRQNLMNLGIDVRMQRAGTAELMQDLAGSYKVLRDDQGRLVRLVTIYTADAQKPTLDNFASLIHEAVHDTFANSSPEMQAKLHEAAKAMTDEMMGIAGYKEMVPEGITAPRLQEQIEQEGRIAESFTRALVRSGFDPEKAGRMVSRVLQFVQDIYHRAVMAVAKMMGLPPSEARAMAYFKNRVIMAMSGQRPMSAIAWLGGPRTFEIPWDEMETSARFRNLSNVSDPTVEISGDVDSTALAEPKLAAENGFDDTLKRMYGEWNRQGLNTAGLTFEDWVRSGNFVEMPEKIAGVEHYANGQLPADVVQATNEALQKIGQQPVKVDIKNGDVTNPAKRLQSALLQLRKTAAVESAMRVRRREAEMRLKANGNRLTANNERLSRTLKDYTDLDLMLSQGKRDMLDLINEAANNAKNVHQYGVKAGMLEQVLSQLDTQIKHGELPKAYETALNRLASRLSGGAEDFKFADTLQRVANLDLDWRNETATGLKDQIKFAFDGTKDPMLAPLLENTTEGRALLGTVIAYAKSNEHHMDLLQLRATNAAGERAEADRILKAAMENHTSAIGDARQLAKKLPTLAVKVDRLVKKLGELKQRNHELIDEIHRDRSFVDAFEFTHPVVRDSMAKLEAQVGATKFEFNVAPGEVYHVPASANSTAEEAMAAEHSLDLKASGIPDDTLKGHMRRMQEWLDGHTAAQDGAAYLQIQHELERLSDHLIGWGLLTPIKGSLVNRWVAPDAEKMRYLGTPLGRLAGAMMESENREWRSRMVKTHELATRWEASRRDAMQALGVARVDTFQDLVHNAAMGFLEKRQDLSVKLGRDQAQAMAIGKAMEYLRLDPVTQKLMAKPGASAAVEKFLRMSADCDDWVSQAGKELGNKVKDTAGNTVYRNPIGQSPFVMPRTLKKTADDFFITHMKAWAGDPLNPSKVAEEYSKDPKAFSDSLKDRFTPDVWNWFVKSIAYRDGRSAFYAPAEGDGMNRFASRENVIKAYEAAGQDPVMFAEALYNLEGGHSDMASFVAETLETIQSHYELLHGIKGESENNAELNLGGPKRWMMDARKSEEAPKEWLEYAPFDKTVMSQIVRAQARQAAYGRNFEAMNKVFNSALEEQQELANKYHTLRARFPELKDKALRKAMMEAAAKDPVYKGMSFASLEEAPRNVVTVKNVMDGFQSRLSVDSARPPEANEWLQAFRALTSSVVAGPATAITAHEVFLEQPFRKFGLNWDAAKFLAGTSASTAKVAMASLLQAVRVHVAWDAEHINALNNVGVYDDDATLALKDKIKGTFFHRLSENPFKAALQLPSRAVTSALSFGVGRAAPGKPILPTVKLSAFHWGAQVIQLGNSVQWAKTFETMLAKGIEHFRLHPDNFEDFKFKFEPKHLGFSGTGRTLEYLNSRLSAYGQGTVEDMVRDAIRRRDPAQGGSLTAPLLTEKQYRMVAMQSLDESTLESSPTTRPGFLTNNALGQAINPMLGWSVHKAYDAYKGFREPDGTRSWRGFTSGLAPYAAIIPIGLGIALLRNKFDEEVLGKKQNVGDLTTINNPEQAFSVMLENTARIGTFGIAGEIPNYWFNQDTTRPVSVDSRVFLVSTMLNVQRSVTNLLHQRTFDYDTVVRPFVQAVGGNGYLQYADMMNHTFSLDNAEARTANRISVNNYLRVAGRETSMEVRSVNGMMQTYTTANPMRPWIGKMIMAAYANDAQGFADARRAAVKAAKDMGKEHPDKSVAQSYEDSSPLRIVFKSLPSQHEYHAMLNTMNESGQSAVASALRLYEHYGQQIGAKASLFGRGDEPKKSSGAGDEVVDAMIRNRVGGGNTLNDLRRQALAPAF